MYFQENNISKTIRDLLSDYHALGVKTEFGEEASTVEETLRLKTMAGNCTVKISGCEAVKDMYDSKSVGATSIVAPMIESPYAMQKYVNCIKTVYPETWMEALKLYINIETIDGFKNLDRITDSEYFENIAGIVFGRTDFAGSLGMNISDVNSEIIFDYACKTAQKTYEAKKEFIIGGGISPEALPFLRKFPQNCLTKIETRKVIFDAESLLSDKNAEVCINKALEFEILWLENKQNMFGILSENDRSRIKVLKSRAAFCKSL